MKWRKQCRGATVLTYDKGQADPWLTISHGSECATALQLTDQVRSFLRAVLDDAEGRDVLPPVGTAISAIGRG